MNNVDHFIEQLVREHSQYLYRIAASIVRDGALAEDIVQDAFVTAMLNQHKLHASSNYRAWLSTIVVNKSRDHLRRHKVRSKVQLALRSVRALVGDSAESRPIEQAFERGDINDTLWKALDKLPEKLQLPLILRYVHGMKAAEIATILSIKEGTVYSRIHTGLRQLGGLLAVPLQQEGIR